MTIAMANDHAGTQMKEEIKAYLIEQGYDVKDFGTYDSESCDLSDYVYPAALAVAKGDCERGIFCDGVGYGGEPSRVCLLPAVSAFVCHCVDVYQCHPNGTL